MMNDDNLNQNLGQNSTNTPNNTDGPSYFNQNNPQQTPIENTPQFTPVQPQILQNNIVKPPKNKKTLFIIIIIFIVLILLGVIGHFVINNLNKPKTNSELGNSSGVSVSDSPAVAFVDATGKKYIEDTNKQYGMRFDNQVILTASVPIDGASTNPQSYDGVAVVAINVSECNHISITSVSMLTCYLDKAEENYYYVVASSNNLGAFHNFREIVNDYKDQSYSLTSKGVAYDDVHVYTRWHKLGILHVYFGHLGVSGQYSPYFYVTFNKASTEKDASFSSDANADAYYKKMSIINVPKPVTE